MKREVLEELLEARQHKRVAVLATTLGNGRQRVLYPLEDTAESPLLAAARLAALHDRSELKMIEGGETFLQVVPPPLRMIVVGAVHIAQALVPIARTAGFEVTVVDPRRAFATEARFPGVSLVTDWPDAALANLAPDPRTAVVALTHDLKLDIPALSAALRSDAFYVGALGSKKTQATRAAQLAEAGFDAGALARIHGPVGLDIGARSAAEIAVSIVAEIIHALRRPA